MPVVYREEGALRPGAQVLLGSRPGHVQDDGDAVFVVVALDALVGVRCVGDDQAVRLGGVLSLVEVL